MNSIKDAKTGINFKIRGDFLLKLLDTPDFQKTRPLTSRPRSLRSKLIWDFSQIQPWHLSEIPMLLRSRVIAFTNLGVRDALKKIAMLNSRLERIFLELILVSFVLGVTKCSLCEHYEPPWPNTQRLPPAESWSVQRFGFKDIRSRQQCCATHPGFISSQASSWLDFGASVPCKTFPVSVWITLTGSSLIWLLSSMGYRTEETQEAACINKSELIFKL